jgi:hypothetical protein
LRHTEEEIKTAAVTRTAAGEGIALMGRGPTTKLGIVSVNAEAIPDNVPEHFPICPSCAAHMRGHEQAD